MNRRPPFAQECKAVGCSRRTRNRSGWCFQHHDMGWQSVDSIPIRRRVMVQTVKGVFCLAMTRGRDRWLKEPDKWGPRRVMCRRLDGRTSGDVVAVAWRKI